MEKRYCAAPWRGLHINFRGDVKTCCAGDPNMLGDLNTSSLENIIHGDRMQEIRSSIQQGILHPEYCYNCIQAERNGSSERDWHNSVNPEFDPITASLYDHVPTLIDVRWNITCNLSCNYCGPYCSSKWAGLKKEFVDNGVKPYHTQVVDYIVQHKDQVREVALVGGEPLLLKENIALLKALPQDCLVTVITNMSVDFDNNPIVDLLKKRTNVGWSMSFDNVGDRFEYVRHGGKFDLLNKNVSSVSKWMQERGHHGGIHSVYNLYNCTKLAELRNYADSHGLSILWQTLYQPEILDPTRHNNRVKQLAIEEIEHYTQQWGNDTFFEQAEQGYNTIATDNNISEKFWQHTHDIENRYHQDQKDKFKELWPELATLI